MEKLKVLLITRECLRTDSNEGNVLLNLFANNDWEIYNIYCKPGLPNNNLCSGYFQLTDQMAVENILHRSPMGRRVGLTTGETKQNAETENKRFYNFFRIHNMEIFYLARDCLWQLADFKNEELLTFINDANPNVIFAPLCYSRFVLAIHRYVIGTANVPAVTYIYDDLYSLKQLRFSPIYWFNRFLLRRAIRKNLHLYNFAYTMTEQQAKEYQQMLGIPMRVLRKCVQLKKTEKIPHEGIRLIYAGGLYYGRDDTLTEVARAVRALRTEGNDVRLDIYTSSPMKKSSWRELNDGAASVVHPPANQEELQKAYFSSDIALHVESFDLKNALCTRLSFSTKIVDCLASGCAVLAICPAMNAGGQYLKKYHAAEYVDCKRNIKEAVRKLCLNKDERTLWENAARLCLMQQHDAVMVHQKLQEELIQLID